MDFADARRMRCSAARSATGPRPICRPRSGVDDAADERVAPDRETLKKTRFTECSAFPGAEVTSGGMDDPNKRSQIFANPNFNLDALVRLYWSEDDADRAIADAATSPLLDGVRLLNFKTRHMTDTGYYINFSNPRDLPPLDKLDTELSEDLQTALPAPCDVVGSTLFISSGLPRFVRMLHLW